MKIKATWSKFSFLQDRKTLDLHHNELNSWIFKKNLWDKVESYSSFSQKFKNK